MVEDPRGQWFTTTGIHSVKVNFFHISRASTVLRLEVRQCYSLCNVRMGVDSMDWILGDWESDGPTC